MVFHVKHFVPPEKNQAMPDKKIGCAPDGWPSLMALRSGQAKI